MFTKIKIEKAGDLWQEVSALKPDSHLPKKICFICLDESTLKIKKNGFYFILKALFALKILKVLSRLFDYVEKTVWFER